MANIDIDQDVAKIDSCSYIGQILSLLIAVRIRRYGSLIIINLSASQYNKCFSFRQFFPLSIYLLYFSCRRKNSS